MLLGSSILFIFDKNIDFMRFLASIILFLTSSLLFSQEETKSIVPRFTKSKIGSSSTFAYFPTEKPLFEEAMSPDSSNVITTEIQVGEYYFSIVHIDLHQAVEDSLSREELLVGYLDFLKDNFSIQGFAGYGKGHTLSSNSKAQGIIDFWKDVNGVEYSVKGWITPKTISIFMIYGASTYESQSIKELYFNSLRFE